jgi:hypothetical protein
MTDNTFDKFVRDKLRDHPSAVPPGLWEKIERKKDKDPKGGFFLPRIACSGRDCSLLLPAPASDITYPGAMTVVVIAIFPEVTEKSAIANNGGNANSPARSFIRQCRWAG